MNRPSENSKSLALGQVINSKVFLLLAFLSFVAILLYNSQSDKLVNEKTVNDKISKEIHHPTVDDIRAAYDPSIHKEKIQDRLKTPCRVSLPTREEAQRNPHRWKVSRYVSYHNIVEFLDRYLNDTARKYIVQDFGVSAFFRPFKNRLSIRRSVYPGVDIHKTPYESNSLDIIGADQVLEHILFPHAAILELKRILKPGGIMILTTCAYNPKHSTPKYPDYWRFLADGLKLLSLPMDGGIKLCGAWGSKEAIALRAKLGLLSKSEKEAFSKILPDVVSNNDRKDPFTTWIILQK